MLGYAILQWVVHVLMILWLVQDMVLIRCAVTYHDMAGYDLISYSWDMILHDTTWYYMILHDTTLYYIMFYDMMWYHMALHEIYYDIYCLILYDIWCYFTWHTLCCWCHSVWMHGIWCAQLPTCESGTRVVKVHRPDLWMVNHQQFLGSFYCSSNLYYPGFSSF